MNPQELNLYCVCPREEEDTMYVLAPTLREALQKYKQTLANYANAEYRSLGEDRFLTVDDIFDPEHVGLVCSSDDLIL